MAIPQITYTTIGTITYTETATITDLTGTKWILNSNLTIEEMSGLTNNAAVINFTSNGMYYEEMYLDHSDFYLYYYEIEGVTASRTRVYDDGTWSNESYRTIEITGGTDATNSALIAWLQANATQVVAATPSLNFGGSDVTLFLGSSYISKVYLGSTLLYEGSVAPSIDPILANNSWATIKEVCQAGNAGNYWSLGDTKNIAVTGVGDVPHAIVDMAAGRYEYASDNTKHSNVVFQSVPTIGNYQFNPSSNTNANGAYNTWYTSDLRTSMNSGTIYGLYDSSFTALLEQVQTYEALDGTTNGNVVQYQADKLFLPAYQEVRNNSSTSYVQSAEKGLNIVEFGYYALNSDANSQRIKYPFGSSSATYWWLRSPYAGSTGRECVVYGNGGMNYSGASGSYGVAPCFAF